MIIKRIGNAAQYVLRKIKPKQTETVVTELKEGLVHSDFKTQSFTDSMTGITKLERKFLRRNAEGELQEYIVQSNIEKLPDGTIERWTSVSTVGRRPMVRTTKTKVEKGASVFGGDLITEEKDFAKWWCHGIKTKTIKHFTPGELKDEGRHLEHIEGKSHLYDNNMLSEYKTATMDRAFDEQPLELGKLFNTQTSDSTNYQHWVQIDSMSPSSNHGLFKETYKYGGKTHYEQAIEANKLKEAQKLEAQAKAEALAKMKAEDEAFEKFITRPRVNTNKLFGMNVEELTCRTTTKPDGTVVKAYFKPGYGKPVIITKDFGLMHEETVYSDAYGKLIFKQCGNSEPYILSQKGHTYQAHIKVDRVNTPAEPDVYKKVDLETMFYFDGKNAAKSKGQCYVLNREERVKNAYKEYPDFSREEDIKMYTENKTKRFAEENFGYNTDELEMFSSRRSNKYFSSGHYFGPQEAEKNERIKIEAMQKEMEENEIKFKNEFSVDNENNEGFFTYYTNIALEKLSNAYRKMLGN